MLLTALPHVPCGSLQGCSASPVSEENMFVWNATVTGPDESPWEGACRAVGSGIDHLSLPPRLARLRVRSRTALLFACLTLRVAPLPPCAPHLLSWRCRRRNLFPAPHVSGPVPGEASQGAVHLRGVPSEWCAVAASAPFCQWPRDEPCWRRPRARVCRSFPAGSPVYSDGSLCLDIIQDLWKPIYTVSTLLTSVQVGSRSTASWPPSPPVPGPAYRGPRPRPTALTYDGQRRAC